VQEGVPAVEQPPVPVRRLPQEDRESMTLHELADRVHLLLHRHTRIGCPAGTVKVCRRRLPWRVKTADVAFRPALSEAGWFHVPDVSDEEGTLLLTRITGAGTAWEAMTVLRAEYAETSRYA
jgi:hypothetical protein